MKNLIRVASILTIVLSIVAFIVPSHSYAQEPAVERVIVQFKSGYEQTITEATERQGGKIHYEFAEMNAVAMTLPVSAIESLREDPNVLSVEKDVVRYPADEVVPYGVDQVEARDVWDANHDGIIDPGKPTGAGRTVCIIDSGLDTSHPDFAGVNVSGYPSGWNTDNYGHGTHVAGTIAAANNGAGVVGVTPGTVSLYIVKVFGDSGQWVYSSTLVNAAQKCRDAGANIISMSLVGAYYSSFENAAFQNLYDDDGILIVAAAGNGGGTDYGYPASYDSVISVAAVNQSNVVASFSRKNDKVELAAPGVSIYSTFKDGGYAYMSGTSMATPHVSASAAVVWSSDPTATNAQVREALTQTALDLGAPGRDNEYGYGLVRTYCAYQYLSPSAPTAVELAHLDAASADTGIRVEWETASELDSLGFNVYRAESVDGPRTRLNADLIASQNPGSPVGATYQFVDETASPGVTYYYWLEAMDIHGGSLFHGPVNAELKPMSRLLPARPRLAPAPISIRGN